MDVSTISVQAAIFDGMFEGASFFAALCILWHPLGAGRRYIEEMLSG